MTDEGPMPADDGLHDAGDVQADSHDDSLDEAALATGQPTSALGVAAGAGDATLDAYDLDDDGEVSIVEGARAQLGVVDARLEQLGERPGLIGKVAEAAHHLVDRLDNDERDAGAPRGDAPDDVTGEPAGGSG